MSEHCLFHPSLVSFALGALRTALAISENKAARENLLEKIDEEKIRKAIDTRNFALAKENFADMKPFLNVLEFEIDGLTDENYSPLSSKDLLLFEFLVKKGIGNFYNGDLQDGWGMRKSKGQNSGGWFDNFYNGIKDDAELNKERKEFLKTYSRSNLNFD